MIDYYSLFIFSSSSSVEETILNNYDRLCYLMKPLSKVVIRITACLTHYSPSFFFLTEDRISRIVGLLVFFLSKHT